MNHDHRQATSNVLGEIIKYRYATPTHAYPPRAVIAEVKDKLNVNISYDKAWRAREEALRLVRGSPEDSYKQLSAFLERVKQVNPGTVTHIETYGDDHFKYCFMALGVSICDFLSCLRPVLATDATHLKGKYRSVLFVATGMDGNNQIYSLVFAIGDSENDASWEWFLRKIYGIIGDLSDLVIISDRYLSIEKAVKEVFQHAHHGVYIYHLKQNLVAKFRHVVDMKVVSALFLCATKTYKEAKFSHLMNEILRISRLVYDYLIDAGVERWACVHSLGRRYSNLTTNIAESLNAVLRDVREYPPVTLLDGILMMLLTWFVDRRNVAAKMKTTLTTWAEQKVRSRDESGRRMHVQPIHHYTWFVVDGNRNAQVDLNEKTCTCNIFQLDQLPCSHALAVAAKLNVSRYRLATKYYTFEVLVAAYAEPIFPVGHVELWNISEEIANMVLLPPIIRVPAGRRRKNKILSQWEEEVRKKCGRCKGIDHNRKICRNPIPVPSSSAAPPQ